MEWGHGVGVYSRNWQKVAERAIAPTAKKGCVSVCDVCAWVRMYVHECAWMCWCMPLAWALSIGWSCHCNNLSFILSITPCPITILVRFLVVTLPWWCESKRHPLSVNHRKIEVGWFTLLAGTVPNNKLPRTPDSIASYHMANTRNVTLYIVFYWENVYGIIIIILFE